MKYNYSWPLAAILAISGTAAAWSSPAATSVHPELWPAGPRDEAPSDAADFVERLLASMTLEEKVGQMIQADIASITPSDLAAYKLGSVLAGGGAAPGGNLRTTPQAWLELTGQFHRAALTASGPAHTPIPLLFGIDAVHGHAKIVGATIFPHNIGLGAAHDPDLIRRIGAATAEEVSVTGIDWTFAPTVAVARDLRWGRSYESYSESPGLVADYAAAMVTGLQGERGTPGFLSAGHTLSSVKHFLGDGATTGGRDQGDAAVPESILSAVHAAGYPAAIKAGVLIVMASYNSWNGVKMHANHYLLTDILKGRLGFDGFVVGDWNAHEQIPGCTKFSCPAAILAGVDMLMAPDSWRELYRNLLAQARSGEIPQSRVDDAVRRILRVKFLAGAFRQNGPQGGVAGRFELLGSGAHRAIAREAVRKSMVLLKNSRGVLPLNPHSNILVAGTAADDIGMQCGGWSIDWQGDRNTNRDFPGATSIYAGIRAAVTAAGGAVTLNAEGRFARRPDAAVVVFGETPYAEFQGDRETLEYAPADVHQLQLLRRLHAQRIPVVAVFLSGRPMWVNRQMNAADAFIAAWLPGSEGEGVADLLFSAADGSRPYDFTGRLSFSWPATGMPVTFDAGDRASGALFERGYGLAYGSASTVADLAVDPRIPRAAQSPAGSLFHAGHATAPWTMFVADGGEEVHVTLPRQSSPHGAVRVSAGSSGAVATWDGSQAAILTISGRSADLRNAASRGGAVRLRYRVDNPGDAVQIGVVCAKPECGTTGGAFVDVTPAMRGPAAGPWTSLSIPLACLSRLGADLSDVPAPFAMRVTGAFAVTIGDVSLGRRRGWVPVQCR